MDEWKKTLKEIRNAVNPLRIKLAIELLTVIDSRFEDIFTPGNEDEVVENCEFLWENIKTVLNNLKK